MRARCSRHPHHRTEAAAHSGTSGAIAISAHRTLPGTLLGVALAALAALAVGPARGESPESGPAASGPGEARMQAFLDGTERLRARFTQSLYDERRSLLETSSGVMFLSRPDRFRWEYREPFEQLIVGDGERVWIHDVDLQQVTVRPVADALGATPASLLSSRRPVRERFDVRELGERDGLVRVALVPRLEDTTFAAVRLGFDEGGLRLMELEDNFGQTTVLVFEGLERNLVLQDSLFTFAPPPGADVVDDL